MSTRIRILSEHICNQIAAGEVVERPASVVKELVENSLDAGASEVRVEVEGGGRRLIRVSDDGCGMGKDDLFLSLERHATSKISSGSDLFHLKTLGFRGEALPSIAAVSRMSLRSRGSDEVEGWEVYVEGGGVKRANAVGGAKGTTIEVRDLFFNTPARRKFLRKDETELGHIAELMTRLAFSMPQVQFRLFHQHRPIIDVPRHARLVERIAALLGRPLLESLVEIDSTVTPLSLKGYVSRPDLHRATSGAIYSYINGRFIRDRVVQHAIVEGVRHLLPRGRYPVAVLFLTLPTELVDVNVHPTKHEVRFSNQASVHDFIVTSIRESLRDTAQRPSGGVFSIPNTIAKPESQVFSVQQLSNDRSPSIGEPPAVFQYQRAESAHEPVAASFVEASPEKLANPLGTQVEELSLNSRDRSGFFSSLSLVGQFARSYIATEDQAGHLVLIDQHAAHERIGFERLKREFHSGMVTSQNLLFPVVVEFGFREAPLIADSLELLARLGFVLEPFGGRSFILKGVPQLLLQGVDCQALLQDIAAELVEIGVSNRIEELCDSILVTISCHSMVRANHTLSRPEIERLLIELDEIDFSATCPHGRPVYVRLSLDEVAKMFRRGG